MVMAMCCVRSQYHAAHRSPSRSTYAVGRCDGDATIHVHDHHPQRWRPQRGQSWNRLSMARPSDVARSCANIHWRRRSIILPPAVARRIEPRDAVRAQSRLLVSHARCPASRGACQRDCTGSDTRGRRARSRSPSRLGGHELLDDAGWDCALPAPLDVAPIRVRDVTVADAVARRGTRMHGRVNGPHGHASRQQEERSNLEHAHHRRFTPRPRLTPPPSVVPVVATSPPTPGTMDEKKAPA